MHRNTQDADMRALASRVRHERHRRVPVDSEHQKGNGFLHWVCKGEGNTTKQESLKGSKVCSAKLSENQMHTRCSMK